MTRQQKKALRERQSTRQLIGIRELTEHGFKIANGEFVIYIIQPDNLSVLSEEGVRQRVMALNDLLRAVTELILIAVDSRESFQRNRDWYRHRLEQEEVPAIRELLRQDIEHLDAIQTGTASSREFAILFRLDEKTADDPAQLSSLERLIHTHHFRVRMANAQEVKRILAVYYQQDAVTDTYDNYDGESAVKQYG